MTNQVTDQDGYEEAVLLFDADLAGIESELPMAEFDALVAGRSGLEQWAASVVQAAYVVVGVALSVRAVVLFTFRVDEEGTVDPSFNLPLRYLADNAGPGPDLGAGPIRLSCRGRCPVPWHSVNLWEPREGGEEDSVRLVQKAIWRNRLGLKPSGALDRAQGDDLMLVENLVGVEAPPDAPAGQDGPPPARGNGQASPREADAIQDVQPMDLQKLIRSHSDRLAEISSKYRAELARQQQGYLEQIKSCREEIRELKSALRHEQQRSRRLQALLRGEPLS